MIKQLFLILLILLLFKGIVFSQDNFSDKETNPPKNAVFIELGGNAFFYSLNYERIFWQKNNKSLNFRIGGAYLWSEFFVPTLVNFQMGNKHQLELGMGIISLMYLKSINRKQLQEFVDYFPFYRAYATANIGYKYQTSMKLFYKINFTPFLFIEGKKNQLLSLFPWGGVAIGYTFKHS